MPRRPKSSTRRQRSASRSGPCCAAQRPGFKAPRERWLDENHGPEILWPAELRDEVKKPKHGWCFWTNQNWRLQENLRFHRWKPRFSDTNSWWCWSTKNWNVDRPTLLVLARSLRSPIKLVAAPTKKGMEPRKMYKNCGIKMGSMIKNNGWTGLKWDVSKIDWQSQGRLKHCHVHAYCGDGLQGFTPTTSPISPALKPPRYQWWWTCSRWSWPCAADVGGPSNVLISSLLWKPAWDWIKNNKRT